MRCVPVTVVVDGKKDIEAELSDKGFKPPVIRIDEGTAIQWKWSGCEVARVISEATYSHRTGKLHALESEDRYHHAYTYLHTAVAVKISSPSSSSFIIIA